MVSVHSLRNASLERGGTIAPDKLERCFPDHNPVSLNEED
ncbi:hypothetical protein CCP3SC1_410010 [Gammaproteobacteria bacterium]